MIVFIPHGNKIDRPQRGKQFNPVFEFVERTFRPLAFLGKTVRIDADNENITETFCLF